MQKDDSIRRMKWAMEDAFLREVGVKNGSTAMRSWNEPWEISTENRDRPGGHYTDLMSGWYAWKKSKFAKRKSNKKMRREHRRITSDAVREFYVDRYDEIMESMEDYGFDDFADEMNSYVSDHPHYFEDEHDQFWDDKIESYDLAETYDSFWDLDYPA